MTFSYGTVVVRAGEELVPLASARTFQYRNIMNGSIDNIGKDPKRGRPSTGATPVMVRVHPDDLENIDAYRARQRPIPSRPEAIRRLTAIALDGIPLIVDMIAYLESLTDDAEAQATADRLRGILERG